MSVSTLIMFALCDPSLLSMDVMDTMSLLNDPSLLSMVLMEMNSSPS